MQMVPWDFAIYSIEGARHVDGVAEMAEEWPLLFPSVIWAVMVWEGRRLQLLDSMGERGKIKCFEDLLTKGPMALTEYEDPIKRNKTRGT